MMPLKQHVALACSAILSVALHAFVAEVVTPSENVNSQQEGTCTQSNSSSSTSGEAKIPYGVDVSFPIHYESVSTNYAWLQHNLVDAEDKTVEDKDEKGQYYKDMPLQPLGDRQSVMDEYLRGCEEHYSKDKPGLCLRNNRQRLNINLKQPPSLRNYTEIGFAKVPIPTSVFETLQTFYRTNKDSQTKESWEGAVAYLNHWESPTYMVNLENRRLIGAGIEIKNQIWEGVKPILEEWTGWTLRKVSLFGIRVYTEGSMLATHVDRLPLVTSAIINVDQDVDEEWPLEVIGRDGVAVNITLQPGEMILYESHTIPHGRPFALKGRHYANAFVHFEPVQPIKASDDETYDSMTSTDIKTCKVDHSAPQGQPEIVEQKPAKVESDDDPVQCPLWAKRGECQINPKYMKKHCRHSCSKQAALNAEMEK